MEASRLATLLHLCDSLFPTGGYSHSDGLEAATTAGLVSTAADLRDWVCALLEGPLRTLDGPAVRLAWERFVQGDIDTLSRLDDDVHALRPAMTSRQASRSMGTRLLKTWQHLYPDTVLEQRLLGHPHHGQWTLQVAFGAACASAGLAQRASVEAYLYTRIAAVASTAMRLMPVGQLEAHRVVAEAALRLGPLASRILAGTDPPAAFAPLMDVASMQQQYVASRLFRS